MKKILVTGSTGLLGNVVCNELVNKGHHVFAITNDKLMQNDSIDVVNIDLGSDWSISDLPAKVDIIIHLAQSKRYQDFPKSALDIFNVNIKSTAKLLDYGLNSSLEHFIYTSSGGVYGNRKHAFSENESIIASGELGYYLGSKASGEILVQSYLNFFNVSIFRPFFIYGPNQNRNMLIPRLFDFVKNSNTITIQGEKGICINPVHVNDAAFAILASLSKETNKIYNIAGPETISLKELCILFGDYLNKEPKFEYVSQSPRDIVADISLMEKELLKPTKFIRNHIHEIE